MHLGVRLTLCVIASGAKQSTDDAGSLKEVLRQEAVVIPRVGYCHLNMLLNELSERFKGVAS